MNLLDIPFVKQVGLQADSEQRLTLPFSDAVQNHLQTIHASAQFTLAETASGQALLGQFPQLAGKVVPVLRDADIKFKKPALRTIAAYPAIAPEAAEKFLQQMESKGRGSIAVMVEVRDSEDTVTAQGEFAWFVTRI